MVVGERVEGRLKSLRMSQAELARRTGLHQTTINQLINRGGNTTRLHLIARELETTPAYLAGETDDPAVEFPEDILISEERELIGLFRLLREEDRKMIARLTERLGVKLIEQRPGPPTLHDERQSYRPEDDSD